jgi:two-component system LytT family response regulator
MEEKPTAMVLVTLKQWERLLPRDLFCRIHRGYIVAIEKVQSFDNRYVYLSGEKITIGEQYRSALPGVVTILANEPTRKDLVSELEY